MSDNLAWRSELARRKYFTSQLATLAVDGVSGMPLHTPEGSEELGFVEEGQHLSREVEKSNWRWTDDLSMRTPLERRLFVTQELNGWLRPFDDWPEGHGMQEFELHWYRWAAGELARSFGNGVIEREMSPDMYYVHTANVLEDLDDALSAVEGKTEDELIQEVHRLQGRLP